MKKRLALAAILMLVLVVAAACTKGRTMGGTEDAPAAVETAGAPPVPEHAPASAESIEHQGTTTAEPHPAGEEGTPHATEPPPANPPEHH